MVNSSSQDCKEWASPPTCFSFLLFAQQLAFCLDFHDSGWQTRSIIFVVAVNALHG